MRRPIVSPCDALHRERLAAVDVAEVGDRLGHAHAGLAGGDEQLVLVAAA